MDLVPVPVSYPSAGSLVHPSVPCETQDNGACPLNHCNSVAAELHESSKYHFHIHLLQKNYARRQSDPAYSKNEEADNFDFPRNSDSASLFLPLRG